MDGEEVLGLPDPDGHEIHQDSSSGPANQKFTEAVTASEDVYQEVIQSHPLPPDENPISALSEAHIWSDSDSEGLSIQAETISQDSPDIFLYQYAVEERTFADISMDNDHEPITTLPVSRDSDSDSGFDIKDDLDGPIIPHTDIEMPIVGSNAALPLIASVDIAFEEPVYQSHEISPPATPRDGISPPVVECHIVPHLISDSDINLPPESSIVEVVPESECDEDQAPLPLQPFRAPLVASQRSQSPKRRRPPKISYDLDGFDDGPVFSWQQTPSKPKKPPPPSKKAPSRPWPTREVASSMFVTQVHDSVNVPIFEAQAPRFPDDAQTPVRSNSTVQRRKRASPSAMQFGPIIPMPKQIDLSRYDDPEFDWETMAESISDRLLALLDVSPESIVFRALCGVSLAEYSQSVISRVLIELKKLLNVCIEKGLIGESSYVQCIIEGIKDERKEASQSKNLTLERVSERLAEAEDEFQRRKNRWETQKAILDTEKCVLLDNIDLKFEEQTAALTCEWNSDHMQAKYNKPSSKLIQMRHHARSLMVARRFDEAAMLAKEIAKREAIETEEAARKMAEGYQQASLRLRQQFDLEKQGLSANFETKLMGILRAEESNLRPLTQRIEKIQKIKLDSETALKRSRASSAKQDPVKKTVPVSTRHEPIIIEAKLKLPPLGLIPKRNQKLS
jgi:hypothetical protein